MARSPVHHKEDAARDNAADNQAEARLDRAASAPVKAEAPHDPVTGEILPAGASTALAAILAAPKVVKRVTIPVLSLPENKPAKFVCKFVESAREGKEPKEGSKGVRMGKAWISIIDVINGETMELERRSLVMAEVLRSELNDNYPDGDYAGKWFLLEKIPPRDGKRYSTWGILEIEDPTAGLGLRAAA